ncbi:MAG: CpaF family protein [Actinobacteria bacterium]|nr:CpaF family protein [Actinomycetota bacterium]
MTNPEQPTPQQPSLTDLPMFLTQPDPAAIPETPPPVRGAAGHLLADAGGPQYSRRGAAQAPQPAPSPSPAPAPQAPRYEDDDEQVDWTLLQSLRKEVAELLDRSVAINPTMTEQDQRAIAQSHALDVIRDRMNAVTAETGDRNAWSAAMQQRLARAVIDGLYGLGRFQPLVDDPTVKNVDIYGNDRVYVKYADGRKVLMPPITPTDQDLIEEIRLIAMRQGEDARPFSSAHPILSMDLPGGIGRLEAVHPPISPRPKVVMRIHRFVDIGLDQLLELGSMTPPMAELLRAIVRAGRSIVVAGNPGAGKTTLVRALCNEIDPMEEIVTIEKERELHLDRMGDRHHIVTPLQYRPGLGERAADGSQPGEITLVQLLESSLRLDSQRIVVGEVRGGEVDAMFQAMQAGVGSISTVHAMSATDTIERLADLAIKGVGGASPEYAYRQIGRHIDFIVQVAQVRMPNGSVQHLVTEIAEITPGEEDRPIANTIFGLSRSRRQVLQAMPTPEMREILAEAGIDTDFFRGIEGTAA